MYTPKPFTHPFGRHACWCVSVFVYQTLFSHSHHHHRRPSSPMVAHHRPSPTIRTPKTTTTANDQRHVTTEGEGWGGGCRCHVAESDVATKRRMTTMSSFVVTHNDLAIQGKCSPPSFFFSDTDTRCHIADIDVATKRRTTTHSSFVVVHG